MKKLFVFCMAILIVFSCVCITFAQDEISNPIKQEGYPKIETQPNPPVPDIDTLDFIKSVSIKVIVKANKYYRALNWYKLEEGTLKDNMPYGLTEDEKVWYEQGYKVEFGKYGEPEAIEITGSGVIILSQEFDKPEMIDGKKIYGETIGITNWHVVEMLINYNSFKKPLYVYDDKDIITSTYPPSFEIREKAKPVGQVYYEVDTDGIYIQHSEKQLYEVKATLVASDRAIDCAVFKIDNVFGLPYAVWRGTPCKVGEEIWICGAPLGLFRTIDKGRINQIDLDLGESYGIIWNDQVKMDIAAAPGSSGSGVFDVYGNLIAQEHGVLVYGYNYISGGQLAINGMSIREFLIWRGLAYTVFQKPYREKLKILQKDDTEH